MFSEPLTSIESYDISQSHDELIEATGGAAAQVGEISATVPNLIQPEPYYGTSIPDKIIDVLYLGDRLAASNKEWLREHGVTHIINIAAISCSCFYPGVFKYLSIPIYDTVSQDIGQFFPACTRFIKKAIRQGGKVLVHCEAGRSRSATIILQYLISEERYTLKEAYKLVKRARIIVMPNITFFAQLRKYEKEVTGKESLPLDVPHYVMYNFKLEKKYLREQRVKRVMERMLPFSFRSS